CSVKEFDSVDVQIGPPTEDGDFPKKTLEGQTEDLFFTCPTTTSKLQMARNSEAALKAAGYTIAFSGKDGEELAVTAQKGGTWVQVKTSGWNEFPAYRLTTARVK